MRRPTVLSVLLALWWCCQSNTASAAEPMISHDVYFTLKHDKYQQAERHHKFIKEFQETWQSVRVFDSYVNVSSHAGMTEHVSKK